MLLEISNKHITQILMHKYSAVIIAETDIKMQYNTADMHHHMHWMAKVTAPASVRNMAAISSRLIVEFY